jgi:transcription initiation factor TFIIH subunit 4
MLTYLETHAHPEMKRLPPTLPATVTDQLRLWDTERNRLTATHSFLYQNFARVEDYQDILEYANDLGCVLWKDDKKRFIVVGEEGHALVRVYVKRKIVNE